ncbi:hypothetical protein ACFJGW_14970 [Burkholderiaceae bacterium UC74_6]
MRFGPLLVWALAAAACAAPQPLSRENLVARIDALIGSAACESDAQCRTIGIGSRPCGGPAGYRPWSTAHADAAALQSAADALTQFDRAEAERLGLRSTCQVIPDPGAVCRPAAEGGRRCRLAAPGPAGQAGGASAI